jgi:hypothetical protein
MTIPKTVARFNAHVTNRVGLLDVNDFLSMRPAPAQF